MTYTELYKLNRAQLLQAQGEAIMTQDTETLKRISKILTGFKPQAMTAGLTYLKDEVEDLDQPGYQTQIRAKHDDFITRSFWG